MALSFLFLFFGFVPGGPVSNRPAVQVFNKNQTVV